MTQIRLADLDRDPEVVELPDGTETRIKRLDGVMAHLWHEFTSTPESDRDPYVLWELAGRCLPDVEQEVVDRLTTAQVGAVIAVASGNAERVLAALKNGIGDEVKALNTSSPEIPSAPPSATSPGPPDALSEPSP